MTDFRVQVESALGDRYRVSRELGRGGMAVVFLAEDLKHHRRVAIKVLKPELAASLGPERFLREITIAAQLAHPNILPLHDSGESGGLLYYVMPFVEGESLRARLLRERQLPVDEAIRIAREVAGALSHAHSLGLVHRDIKPENIMFQAGHAVVGDFGIARAVSQAGGESLTESGLAIGTISYMSPEQATGSRTLDGRSDIYSLACVLYEMLSGDSYYTGAPSPVDAQASSTPLPGLRASRVTITPAIEHVIARGLARLPADRYATASQFAEALEHAQRHSITSGSAAGGKAVRRRWAAAAGALIVLGGAGWWAASRTAASGSQITSLAVLPFQNLSGSAEQEYFVAGVHDALIGQLSRFGALRVISRTSALQYQGSHKPVPEIARELNVDGIVEGTVLRERDSVRIRLELIRARPEERQIWSQEYQRTVGSVMALYDEVGQAIAGEIRLALAHGADGRNTSGQNGATINPDAYDAYLKGRFSWYKLTPPDLEAALQYFELSLRKEPRYALAHSGIALVWIGRLQMGLASPGVAAPRARAAALRALALDSALAEPPYVLGLLRSSYDWDWAGAEAAGRRAIAINPGFADAHAFLAHQLNIQGRSAEARKESEEAKRLDPLNPLFLALDCVDYFFERRYDESIRQGLAAVKTVPDQPVALSTLWIAYEATGAYRAAATWAARYFGAIGQPSAQAAILRGFGRGDYREAMRQGAAALIAGSRSHYFQRFDAAQLFASAGNVERAVYWLEQGYAAKDPNMGYIGMSSFDVLKDNQRYVALLRRLNLPG